MVEGYLLVLCLNLGISLGLFGRLMGLRRTPGVLALMYSDLGIVIWTFGYILEILMPEMPDKLLWAQIQYVGIAFVPVWLLVFILQYTGRMERLRYGTVFALSIIPLLTIGLGFSNDSHHWMWTGMQLQPGWPAAPLLLDYGYWFWVHTAYSYLLLAAGLLLLILFARRSQRFFLSQSLVMLAGMTLPWLANAIYNLGLRPGPGLDLTPLVFTVTHLLLWLGFMRYRLMNVLPVAYNLIYNAMSDGVIVLDLNERMIDANPAARRIFQPGAEFKIGSSIRRLLPAWKKVGGPQQIVLGKDKDRRIFTLQINPLKDHRDQVTGWIAIFTDVTEFKSVHDQMTLQVTALNSAENAFMITDDTGQIEWVNPAFTRLTGYSFRDSVGQNPRMLKSGWHQPPFYKELWQTVQAGQSWHGELINRRKDGSFYYEEMTITPITEPYASTTHFIAVKQDVTARRQADEQLKKAHEEALHANRLKTQLLANVSHDVRTPLGAIIGFVEMLNDGVYGAVNPQQKGALVEILDSTNQLLLFSNNLIGQAQIETGKLILKAKPFEIRELVEAAQAAATPLAQKKGLKLDVQVDLGLPKVMLGDVYWLRQVVTNLVANAVKFTDKGSVSVRLVKHDAASWGIEVTDSGVGIPLEAQAVIFEPFQQADSSDTRQHVGSGLGLSIVKELANLMGGTVRVVSQVGAGSTFMINLPILKGEIENG